MKKRSCFLLIVAALSLNASAQKPKTAPAQKTSVGTVQMPGDNGKLGTTYQLGAKGDQLNFTLEKAEFASRFISKDKVFFAPEGKRLLVLTYAVQNPRNEDMLFFEQSFKFTVVSPDDENYEFEDYVFHPDRRDRLNLQLKPAQKIRAVAVIPIHARGPVNKLIVMRGEKNPVLRYDLRDKVKAQTGAFAAAEGLEMSDVGSALPGIPFELGPFDITLEKVEDVATAIGEYEPGDGKKLVVATVTVKNASMSPTELHYSILTPTLKDTDGSEAEYAFALLKMTSGDQLNVRIEPGEQVRARLLLRADAAAKPSVLILKEEGSGRSVRINLGS